MIRILSILLSVSCFAQESPYGLILPTEATSLPTQTSSFRISSSSEILNQKLPANTSIVATLQNTSLEDKSAWKKITSDTFSKHQSAVSHWDIHESFNLLPRQTATPFHYVELLTIARQNAQTLPTKPKIGFCIANYDLEFLDAALRDGAAGNFDYISLSPFPANAENVSQFPQIISTIKTLFKSHKHEEVPIHITLTGSIGDISLIAPLALASGFEKVFIDSTTDNLLIIPVKSTHVHSQNFADKSSVSITLGKTNTSNGIYQFIPSATAWDEETQANRLRVTAIPPQTQTDFVLDHTFVTPESREFEITVTAKRISSDDGLGNPTGISLTYESIHGYRDSGIFWTVPGENKWQTHTWKIKDAAFNSLYGWNIRLDAAGSGNDVLIQDITIKR